MLSFFSKKATIHSIQLPDLGWTFMRNEPTLQIWVNPDRPIAISINFFQGAPDIPPLGDIAALRQFYRNQAEDAKGGLIEVSLIQLQGYAAVRTIIKLPQQEQGLIYLGSLTLPFRDCSYVIKVQAFEDPTTVMRHTIMLDQLMETGVVKLRDSGLIGWNSDPYDPDFQGGNLMNLGEQTIYDSQFPDHPLSQARAWLDTLQDSVVFKEELGKLKGFGK